MSPEATPFFLGSWGRDEYYCEVDHTECYFIRIVPVEYNPLYGYQGTIDIRPVTYDTSVVDQANSYHMTTSHKLCD